MSVSSAKQDTLPAAAIPATRSSKLKSFSEAWQLRYGHQSPIDLPDIAPFLQHRSVRHYTEDPVEEDLVSGLIAAAQSAATSSNLQLWSVISVQGKERREAIVELCDNQKQIRTAPWFFAFIVDHHRLRLAAKAVDEQALGLDYAEFFIMACIDAALAAERFVCAAEAQGLGICYIGALRNNPDAVADLLRLPPGTFGVFGLCLGYPHPDFPAEIKPRLPQSSVWFREQYDPEVSVGDYDHWMTEFYKNQNMKGDATWSMRSGRRVDENHLTGREVLKEFLERKGFNAR